jgi:hypothetical protein
MKRLLVIYIILLQSSWSFCQDPVINVDFQNLPELTGQQFKLLDHNSLILHRHIIGLKCGVNFSQQPENDAFGENSTDSIREYVYSTPELHKKLIQEFGGEFFIGESELNGEPQNVEMSPAFQFGLFFGQYLSRNVKIDLGYLRRQHDLSGDLPLTIYTQNNTEPFLTTANLSSEATFNTLNITATYILSTWAVEPYAGLGLFWQWQHQAATRVEMNNTAFDLPDSSEKSSYPGMSFNAGASVDLAGNLDFFIDLEYLQSFSGKDEAVKGSGFALSAGLSFRW